MGQLVFQQSGTTRLTTTKTHDLLNRLQSIASTAAGSGAPTLPVAAAYLYNQANQRTRRTEGDGSYWIYAYDALGQVTSGRRYWPDGTPVAGQQFDYAHDDIGNRTGTDTGGDSAGGGLRHANYTANRLNQSTQRDVPGYVDILGLANPTAPVTVNGNPASRKGEYFHYPLAIANGSAPQFTSVSVVSTYGATQTSQGGVYLPKTPEAMAYDSDGNLTGDGRFNYTWDGENRVTRFERVSGAPTAAQVRVDLDYDSQSRRIQKIVSTNNGSLWIGVSTNRYLYDGWNLVAVLDHANNLVQSFAWGSDLSGSPQGAGGVGGLLSMTVASGTLAGTYFYAHDGNGNVLATVNAADGSLAARYDYGPFGEPVRASGPLAQANPFRFSTKFYDPETGLLYYGYRYYDPSTGRWPNRDPIGERGGVNIVCLLRNDAANYTDYLGLDTNVPPGTDPRTPWPYAPRFRSFLHSDDLEAIRKKLDAEVRHIRCCCESEVNGKRINRVDVKISGTASGSTITESATVNAEGCIEENSYQYFWWNCFDAQKDFDSGVASSGPSDWHEWGWSKGEASVTKTHKGISTRWHDERPYFDMWDAGRWNWSAAVIYIYCSKDGFRRAGIKISNYEEWEWNSDSEMWSNPHDGGAR